ncbi:MAG: ribonuclease T2 family protein [Sphingomonadaceae bacterium]
MALPAIAQAQAIACALPTDLPRPRADGPDARDLRRVLPIAGYTLALSWAPQFCRARGSSDSAAIQCRVGNRFGFILHGLWPDGPGGEWPQYCRPVALLSEATLRRNLCATPSVQLLQRQWTKHGSCMNTDADGYFRQATALYGRIRYPDMGALSRRPTLTAGALVAAIARINPGLQPSMLRITTERGGWLDEVRICLDRNFRYMRCNPLRAGVGASAPVRIWRGAVA